MANTVQDNNRVAWGYVSDNGTTYAISAKAVYVLGDDAAKWGGSAAAASTKQIPKGLRPRKVLMKNTSSNKKRYFICYTVTATCWTTPGTTCTVNENGVDATYEALSDKLVERRQRSGTRDTA